MPIPDNDQLAEIEFISGVTAAGTVSGRSFDSWNRDDPATFGATSDAAKWGPSAAGTAGEVLVAFNPASHWTATEQQGFQAAMDLWSDVANVRFDLTGSTTGAGLVITRASNRQAEEDTSRFYRGYENTTELGTLLRTSISIDPAVAGFGPIGGSLSAYGGYPWMTIEHELGHAIGLGHAGPYNDDAASQGDSYSSFTGFDSRAWSIMSYHDIGNNSSPTTPMILDIAAAQRLYGVATDSPLSGGGQVFGFHSNITGDTAKFFDFSINATPNVTIWDGGSNNTLDLSGFSSSNTVSLVDGSLNNVGNGNNDLGIAFGTRIETVVGGSGTDRLTGNALNDLIQGGGGDDVLTGGSGNDHLFGNLRSSVQGASDGNDVIDTGGGNDYVNGNAGADRITAQTGDNRLYGGAGDDTITAYAGNDHINGNAGNDVITAGAGNDTILGGQGDDRIHLGSGNSVVSGDQGNDHFFFGPGYEVVTGGPGNDLFEVGRVGQAPLDRGGALAGYVNEITDFQPGSDILWFPRAIPDVLHDAGNANHGSVAEARGAAQALFNGHAGHAEVAAMQVGSDTYLFWNAAGTADAIDAGLKLDNLSAASFTAASLSSDESILR